jgi:hypothetical protein
MLPCLPVYGEWHSSPMAEESKSIDSRDRRTCMIFLPLALCRHSPSRKLIEVTQGIEYIHSEGVIHGDLRAVVFYLTYIMLKC